MLEDMDCALRLKVLEQIRRRFCSAIYNSGNLYGERAMGFLIRGEFLENDEVAQAVVYYKISQSKKTTNSPNNHRGNIGC